MHRLGVQVRLIAGSEPDAITEKTNRSELNTILRILKMRREVIRCIESGWPDIVYYRKGIVDPGFYHATKEKKIRVCVEINGNHIAEGHHFVGRRLITNILSLSYGYKLRRADLIISVSLGLRERLLRGHRTIRPEKIIVANNGVDTNIFYPRNWVNCRKELKINRNLFLLLFAGKIAKWHGIETAIEAAAILNRQYEDKIRLYIVGDGPYAHEVKHKVKTLGLEKIVLFTGLVSQAQVAKFIGASNICIAPFTADRNDTLGISPLKLFEYIACGRPVICSEVSGIRDVIEETKGFSQVVPVKADDPGSLSDAAGKILNSTMENISATGDQLHKISWMGRSKIILDTIRKFCYME